MLDRSKLIKELQAVSDKLFIDSTSSYNLAQEIWQKIANDSTFIYKVRAIKNTPWPVPLWSGYLSDIIAVEKNNDPYCVLSVDGSQIYPDRHHALSCFLINIGSVILPYSIDQKGVQFFSDPSVFSGTENGELPLTTDTVNCKRQELELSAGLQLGKTIKDELGTNTFSLLLFDGSLIFWHLSSKEVELRDRFLYSYLLLLKSMYQEKIITAWYISMPKSKELLNLVRLYLCNFDVTKTELYESVNKVIDSGIVRSFLHPYTRSIIFQNRSSVSEFYPEYLKPFFFYINTGNEIGRVEIPAWIAQDDRLITKVAQCVIDQCVKGGGYPVALAEAHEQAVVKGPDRDFFYHVLQKMGMERNFPISISRKNVKKRGIGI